jgi:Beta-lactamase class C and other penicillin binding proteins
MMQMKKLLAIILSLSLAAASALGQTKNVKTAEKSSTAQASAATVEKNAGERAAQVDALMAQWKESPGAAVLVVQDGRILLSKGYGLSNVETKEPIRPDTVFDLASVSKQFTAMAILMLAERGKLSLDDPLSKFFPEFPPYAQKITVRHILNHTSGLPDYMQIFTAAGKIDKDWKSGGFEPTSADTVKLLAEQKELRFAPGEKWEYSNSGYVVLGQIAGKAAGQPLPQFLKENVFQKLGMKNTLVSDESKPKIKNRAISYGMEAGKYANADYTPLNLIYGDGNVNTTIEDMFLWDQALYTEKLVKAATLKQAFTVGKLTSGKETEYGFGWFVGQYGGLEIVAHSGGWAGFRTDITRFPQEKFTVVVLSNLGNFRPGAISRKIAAIYLGDKLKLPVAVKVDSAILQKYVGEYELRPGFILTVTLDNDVLSAQATGQGKVKLVAKSEKDFHLEIAESIGITFNRDEKGEVTSLTLHQNGDHPAKKIK